VSLAEMAVVFVETMGLELVVWQVQPAMAPTASLSAMKATIFFAARFTSVVKCNNQSRTVALMYLKRYLLLF
jgi:hypothetical protein